MIEFLKTIFGGQDVFIIAGGPSLEGFDFSRLDDKKTIAINHSYEYLKKPDLLCFMDSKFYLALSRKGHKVQDFNFPVLAGPSAWSLFPNGTPPPNVTNINNTIKDPKDNSATNLFTKRNSGGSSAALGISAALWAGARKIYLLGVDLYFKGRSKHFYSKDFEEKGYWQEDPSEMIRLDRTLDTFKAFENFKDRIINLSLKSKVDTFTKKNINEVLKR